MSMKEVKEGGQEKAAATAKAAEKETAEEEARTEKCFSLLS